MKIGIMGGTFNPIHLGHLILSEFIREEALLDKIIFIPTGKPPHKDYSTVVDGFHRKTMTKLSIEDNPYFSLSSMELESEHISYTIDTMMKLKEEYKDDDLFMIIGADSLLQIETWEKYDKLLKETNFIVADRLVKNSKDLLREIKRLNIKHNVKIKHLQSPIIDISSTKIRNMIKENKSIKYLVKEDVNKYILENNLYK
ncbi:MAG: nicotinate-nucleotide adenylyltransferase [Tissierella sp.]|uniref:nicotinate-nucleotide adenylyltransferase n=1 Tax=Tissierella sp. TaxID=41274 RepID=UPI003F9D2A80